jgi:serine/threonine protein phosphatase PrpC
VFDFFKKLFSKKEIKGAVDSAVTAPLSDVQLQSIKALAQNRFEPVQFIVASGQSVGRQRELNEDCLFTFTNTVAGNSSNPPFGLFIIADGMGGHQYGEIASNTAIRTISGYVMKKFHNSLFSIPTQPVDESLQEIIQAAVMEAQRAVLREAPGSGTTVTAALVMGQQLTIAHVGDSRAYLLYNAQRMEAITRDHSLVRRLEELGQITAAEAAVHPQRNVLYRAIGQGETLESDVVTTPFPIGGYLLICSDGLWGLVPDEEMRRIVYEAPNIQTACHISVILAQLIG